MKQISVAEKAGYTPTMLNGMIKGRRLIRPCDVKIIANALGVDANALFKKEGD